VVTGNRSVVDGWTTFNSATFGERPLLLVDDLLVSVFIWFGVSVGDSVPRKLF